MLIKGILTPEELFALTKFVDEQPNRRYGTNEEVMAWIADCAQKREVPNLVGFASDRESDVDPVPFARILKTSSFGASCGTLFRVTVEIRTYVYIFHDYDEEKDEKYANRGAENARVKVPLAFYMKVLSLMGVPESPEG